MKELFNVDVNLRTPIYKQLLSEFERLIDTGEFRVGMCIPSMNELSAQLNISKETVKKVYSILRERGAIESIHGKGFFVTARQDGRKLRIFLLLDKLSQYKQILYDAFISEMRDKAEVTIYMYNQDIETFESFIDSALDNYDYYLVTPHFPLDAETQARALKTLKRIPNRKLIVLDNWLRSLQGNYGAIYQDMANDIFDGLSTAIEDIRKHNKLHVIIHPTSLYGSLIMVGISRFCEEYSIEVEFHYDINESIMQRGNLYLLLNGQLGIGLVEMARSATNRGLQIGKDVGVISYNESYLSEIILGGLTTVSTDFEQMGRLAAQMVLSNNFKKIKCDFKLIRRNTF